MWAIEVLNGYKDGAHYLIVRVNGDGCIADNSKGGGALHFLVKNEAEAVRDLLNVAKLY